MCRRAKARSFARIGGLFVGLISTGLGEATSYALVKRCRVPTRISVATSVTHVALTALAASVVHGIAFVTSSDVDLALVGSLVVFTIPGVIIGGQLGPSVTARVKERMLIRSLGWLFLLIAGLTLFEALS